MAVLGVGNSLTELVEQLDSLYRDAAADLTAWWLTDGRSIQPIVAEVVQVLPSVSLAIKAAGADFAPSGVHIPTGTGEVLEAFTKVATVLVPLSGPEPVLDPKSTEIGGPGLEKAIRDSQTTPEQPSAQPAPPLEVAPMSPTVEHVRPTSPFISGPELEQDVQATALAAAQAEQRRQVEATLDKSEANFFARHPGLDDEARMRAESQLAEARKEALRALEERQRQDREREGPGFP